MKRLLAFLLILALAVFPLLCACTDSSTSDESSVADKGSETASEAKQFPLAEQHFDDMEITILTRSKRYSQQFCPNEEYEGSAINAAVEKRNAYIEDNYGIRLSVHESVNKFPAEEVEELIISNMDDYDIICDAVFRMVPQVVDGHFYSLNDMLELDRPWWDQNANSYLTLSDKIFFVAGDALFTDDLMTSGVFFNKEIYNNQFANRYGSLYDMVDEGKWTYDVMYEMAREFGQPDESGQWLTENAYYGILTDGYTGATMLVNGSGTVTASKDEQNNISLHVGSESSLKAFDKVYDMLMDNTTTLFVEQLSVDSKWGFVSNMFIAGHGLFRIAYIDTLLSIKESEESRVDPGVLPIPKYTEEQPEYYCGVNAYQSDVLGIPITNNERLKATCYLMELLGYYSSSDSIFEKESVTSAFYDTTLKYQSVTDDNDCRMLDTIRNSRIYDLGGIFNWGGNLIGVYSGCMYRKTNSLQSDWDRIRESTELEMNKTIEAYKSSIN